MKKQFISMTIIGLSLVSLVSCTKEDTLVTPTKKVDVNRVVFESIEEYENLFEDPATSEEKINKVSARFGTYNEAARVGTILEDTLYPQFLQKILNDDHVVQISKWLIKVDAAKDQVLVLDTFFIDQYNDLASGNVSNKNIIVYSTEDDVINMLENGELKNARLFCRDNGADPRQNNGDAFSGVVNILNFNSITQVTRKFQIETRYLRLGIYFELKAKASYEDVYGVVLNVYGRYRVACDGGDRWFNDWHNSNTPEVHLGGVNPKPYTGIKKLTKFDLTAVAYTKDRDYYSNQHIIASPSRNINYGY